jgi:hypothetical protein
MPFTPIGIMHYDMAPFAPFTQANPLLGAISLGALHLSCSAADILALVVVYLRRIVARPPRQP